MLERRLGEAVTDHERALEQVVSRVPEWQNRDIRYTMLVGGLSNQNWRVAVDSDPREYFAKVPGVGTEFFIDRRAANAAARNAQALGIGPDVIFFDPTDGVEICEFLPDYRACTNADVQDEHIQLEVMDLYRRLHSGPPLPLTKTIFDMIEEHFEQGRQLGCHFPEDFEWLEAQYKGATAALMASGLDIVPCFNDPMPGNFLISNGRPMKLVDYEFASNNERSYELAVLLAEMFYPEERMLELIEAYSGELRSDIVARVHVNPALADIKWGSWGIVNRKLSAWDFDYQKYGFWKYMRARCTS